MAVIIRRYDEIKCTERHVFGSTGTWDSKRYILADDGVGFSFHITTLYHGAPIPLWYKNHVEAVYVISGHLYIDWVNEHGTKMYAGVRPGDLYLLDKNDRHELLPLETTTVACVFNPPVTGTEDHDEDGAYELSQDHPVSVSSLRLAELKRVQELYYQGYRSTERQVTIPRERYEELLDLETHFEELRNR